MHTGIWLTDPNVTETLVNGNLNKSFIVAAWLDWGMPGSNYVVNNY